MANPYVQECDDFIILQNTPAELIEKIPVEGIRKGMNSGEYQVPVEWDKRYSIFIILRDLGFAFSIGRGWSPAAQFEDLRKKGLVAGAYKQIFWRSPSNYEIVEK
jgi:hypothetical protein